MYLLVVRLPAYQQLVDGVVLPVRVSGDVALDFCNTAAGWGEPDRKEYLGSYEALVAWARAAALIDAQRAGRLRALASEVPRAAEEVRRRALRLREAVYETALGGAAWEVIAEEAERAARAARLTPAGWELPERLDLPVLAVARAAADFLLGAGDATVRACPGHHCGWLFLDPSGRRRWCSMATCGNRAKQRRHAERVRLG
jgi:predicted RNA-binding Zn ribbon-like protein